MRKLAWILIAAMTLQMSEPVMVNAQGTVWSDEQTSAAEPAAVVEGAAQGGEESGSGEDTQVENPSKEENAEESSSEEEPQEEEVPEGDKTPEEGEASEEGSGEEETPAEEGEAGSEEEPVEEDLAAVSDNRVTEDIVSVSDNGATADAEITPLNNEEIQLFSFNTYYSEGRGYPVLAALVLPKEAYEPYGNLKMAYVNLSVDGTPAGEFDIVKEYAAYIRAGSPSQVVGRRMIGYFGYNKAISAGSHTISYEIVMEDSNGGLHSVTRETVAEFVDEKANGESVIKSNSQPSQNYMSGKKGVAVYKISFYDGRYQAADEKITSVAFRHHETGQEYPVSVEDSSQYANSLSCDSRYSMTSEISLSGQSVSVYVSGYNVLPSDLYNGSASFDVRLNQELPEGSYDVVFRTNKGRVRISENEYYATTRPVVLGIERPNTYLKNGIAIGTDSIGDYISVFVYGFNLTGENVPVFYDSSDTEYTNPLTRTLSETVGDAFVGFEEYENGIDFCVRKIDASSSVWNKLKEKQIKQIGSYSYVAASEYPVEVQGAPINKNATVSFYPSNVTRYEYINANKLGLTKRLRIYVSGAFFAENSTAYVKIGYMENNQWKEYSTSGTVQKDSDNEYYVEFGSGTDLYKKMAGVNSIDVCTDRSYDTTKTDSLGLSNSPAYINNIKVPSGGRWEIHPANEVAKVVYSGTNTGASVLDAETVNALAATGKQYRVCTYKADGSLSERKLVFFYGVKTAAPSKIALNKTKVYMKTGDVVQLTATVSPANAVSKAVTWESSAPETVSVNPETGEITALAKGEADITVKSKVADAVKKTCRIIVLDPEGTSVAFDLNKEDERNTDDTLAQEYASYKSDVTYRSDNTSVVTVSSTGVITRVGVGSAKVIARLGDIEIEHNVTVSNPLKEIRFEDKEVVLGEYEESVINAIIYNPAYTTDSKTITKVEVGDETIANAEVVAGRYIRITRAGDTFSGKEGKTTVTAYIGSLTAVCEVEVKERNMSGSLHAFLIYGLTNEARTLADLQGELDKVAEGYTFQNPDTVLAPFAGISQKSFSLDYTDANGKAESANSVRVCLMTIAGIDVSPESPIVVAGDTGSTLNMSVLWSGYDVKENDIEGDSPEEADEIFKILQKEIAEKRADFLKNYTYEVTSNKPEIVSTTRREDGSYTYQGLAKGKATLTVVLRKNGTEGKDGILFKKAVTIQVVDRKAAIKDISISGAVYNEAGKYYVVQKTDNTRIMLNAQTEGYKLSWSSSDGVVAKIEKAQTDGVPLTVKSTGLVKLTVTANDAAKTKESVLLYVLDKTLNISSDVTVNKAMTEGTAIDIFAEMGDSLPTGLKMELVDADGNLLENGFVLKNGSALTRESGDTEGSYKVSLQSDSIGTGKYKVMVRVSSGENVLYTKPLTITVTNAKPTYSMKQTKKVNLFYNDAEGNGSFSIIGKSAELENAVLMDCDFDYDLATGEIRYTGTDLKTIDKKGVMELTFAGYKPIKVNVTIATETKKPKITLSAASSTLYPKIGIAESRIQMFRDGSPLTDIAGIGGSITQTNLAKDSYVVSEKDGSMCYQLKDGVSVYPKSQKITFSLKLDNWREGINVSHTVKSSTSNPKLKLSSTTVTLNKNTDLAKYQYAEINVRVKDATEMAIPSISLAGTDAKSREAIKNGLDFDFDKETGVLKLWFNEPGELKKNTTYTFRLSANIANLTSASTTLKVKIVDQAGTNLAVSTKGSIDVLDRNNTFIIATPKLGSLSGTVKGVQIRGRDRKYFSAWVNQKGETVIEGNESCAYNTKYGYKISLEYTLESGPRTYKVTTKDITIKVKQGKVSIAAALRNNCLYQTSGNEVSIDLGAVNASTEELKIRDVSIVEEKNMQGAFKLEYDKNTGLYKLSILDGTKLKKNTTYTVKLSLLLKGQADNLANKTVSVKVKVK